MGTLLVKLSNDYIDKKDVNWEKELGTFFVSSSASKVVENNVKMPAGGIVAGPAGVAVGIVVGGVVEVSVGKIWDRISAFSKGGVPLD